jgi:anaerobic nitric oxide reductase transcription regulator
MAPDRADLLAGLFAERIQRRLGLGYVRISPQVLEMFSRYHWPGNVRELENVLSGAILKASREIAKGDIVIVQPIHLGHDFESASQSAGLFSPQKMVSFAEDRNFRDAVIEFKKTYIQRALAKHNGNWAAAARTLGMHRSNLHNLAGRLGLRKPSN